jgi:hypothetical protein
MYCFVQSRYSARLCHPQQTLNSFQRLSADDTQPRSDNFGIFPKTICIRIALYLPLWCYRYGT